MITTPQSPAASRGAKPAHHDEIDLLDLLIMLAKRKKMILSMMFGATIISLLVTLLLPKIYTGTAVIMPPQQDQSTAAALLGQLISGGSSGGGIATALGLKNPNDLYVGILKSRTIADKLIERFALRELYDEDTLVETRDELEKNTTVTAGKDGLIKVEFEDKDPKRAANIANAYVEELENLTAQLAISEAARRRLYFEKKLKQVREDLSNADLAMKAVQERTGLFKLDDQAKPIFEIMASLRARIAAKEIELTAMKTFATEKNPDYIRAQQELAQMRKQLVGLERDNELGKGDILIPTERIPQVGLEYLNKLRDVKYNESLYELLAKQYELARIDEGKNATVIQLVDKAVEPDKKSKPKRAFIVILSTLLVGILGVLAAFIRELYEQASANPDRFERIQRLWGYLHNK